MRNDVMIDIETLGKRAGCVVLSIGAVKFDRKNGDIRDTFYRCISLDDACNYGEIDPDTLMWWMSQSEQSRKDVFSGLSMALEAANDFAIWLKGGAVVWGNGSVFDITILEEWFRRLKVETPWKFWDIRDVRTVVDIMGINPKMFKREGTYHNALDDAIHQVKYMCSKGL